MEADQLNIHFIRKCISNKRITWTVHCLNRLNQREISISDVKKAINNGRIIEFYYDDFPYPSCLILGTDVNHQALHVVCGVNSDLIHMITAYHPDSNKWEDDMKIRRGG